MARALDLADGRSVVGPERSIQSGILQLLAATAGSLADDRCDRLCARARVSRCEPWSAFSGALDERGVRPFDGNSYVDALKCLPLCPCQASCTTRPSRRPRTLALQFAAHR